MDEKTLLQTVAEILEVEVAEVSMESSLESLGWDSLANITFIAEVDDRAGVTVDADVLAEAVTVADLHNLASGV